MELHQRPLKGASLKERREFLYVMNLRRSPLFSELVDRLRRGQSIWSVSEWFTSQPNRAELANCSFETIRKYVTCLSTQMKKIEKKVPKEKLNEFRDAVFTARTQTQTEAAVLQLPPPPSETERAITEEIEKLDAITMLQYCFAIQRERVIQMRQLEVRSDISFPFGNKHLQVLKEIASEFWRVQAGEALLRSKNAWPINMGEVSRTTIDLLPVVREIAELDPTDQNLIREALDKTISLLEEASDGKYSYKLRTQP